MVIVTPPCNTFSRAVFANRRGPAPVRDWQWPRGFPWLAAASREAAEGANELVDFSVRLLQAAAQAPPRDGWRRCRGLLEHPEDLGSAALGEPASIWQWPEVVALGELGYRRVALYQCQWADVDYAKPTALLSTVPELQSDSWRNAQ